MSFDYLMGYIMSISMSMQNVISIFHSVQEIGRFNFFRIWSSAKPRPLKNVISQSLGLDLVNINVYAKVYQNIPLSQETGLCSLFQNLNLGNASANPKWHLTISWATSCQYQCVCKILSKYSKRFKSYWHFSTFFDIFHEQAWDKILTNSPVTKSNVWL